MFGPFSEEFERVVHVMARSQNKDSYILEERLELYRDKLDKVNAVKDDLQSHIQSLPGMVT